GQQRLFSLLPRFSPTLRYQRCLFTAVGGARQPETCLLDDSLILPGWTEDVEADRAARGNFLLRNQSADHQSVTEQHPSSRFKHSTNFTQNAQSSGKMAQNVVRESRVKGRILKRQFLGCIADLKPHLRRHVSRLRKLAGRVDTRRVRVQPNDATTHGCRNLQRIPPRTAADFQHVRTARQMQRARYFLGFFRCYPACLPEVFSIRL